MGLFKSILGKDKSFTESLYDIAKKEKSKMNNNNKTKKEKRTERSASDEKKKTDENNTPKNKEKFLTDEMSEPAVSDTNAPKSAKQDEVVLSNATNKPKDAEEIEILFPVELTGNQKDGEDIKLQLEKELGDVGNGTFPKTRGKAEIIPKKVFYKRLVEKKLTIVLIENTVEVTKLKDTLTKMIKSLVPSGFVCVINYGSVVRESEIVDISKFDDITFLCDDDVGDAACLHDSLVSLESLISKKYMITEETEKERIKINDIEVIGIGSCMDNCSKASKAYAMDCFYKIVNKTKIATKYFCLTETNFLDAAEIGFRSIGAISRTY